MQATLLRVREEGDLERLCGELPIDVDTRVLTATHRDLDGLIQQGSVAGSGPLADRVAAFEREAVLSELAAHGHRVADTAHALGLERSHLYKKCQQLGIDLKAERAES